MSSLQILIADHSDLLIEGIRTALSAHPRYEIVAQADTAQGVIAQVADLQPDVLIISEQLHACDLPACLQEARAGFPALKIIVLGVALRGAVVRGLIACGADGYLHLHDPLIPTLALALAQVTRGQAYLSPTASAVYLTASQGRPLDALDPQAREVLRLLVRGWHVDRIAHRLNIKRRRVYWIRHKLRDHFDVQTNEHLITRALAEGFTPHDP